MKQKIFVLLGLLIVVLPSLPSLAVEEGGLVETWSSRTHLVLAQCMLAEADENKDDHIAIAYTALNWRNVRRRTTPNLRYVDVLRSYCSVHRLQKPTKRQRWIRELGFPKLGDDGNPIFQKPVDYPTNSDWRRKKTEWRKVLQRAYNWNFKQPPDPCRRKAVIWGAPQDPHSRWYSPTDKPTERLVRVQCQGELQNWYYRYKI